MGEPVEPDSGHVGEALDDVLGIMADKRRRFVLHHLDVAGGPVAVSELAERLGEWDDFDPRAAHRVLVHRHLPKMANGGLIHADPGLEEVRISSRGERVNGVRSTCVEDVAAICG